MPITIRSTRVRTFLWTWGPVLALMALLFAASAQPKNPPPPGAGQVYLSGAMPVFRGMWDLVIKKSSHIAGYGLLTLLWMRAWRSRGMTARQAAALAVLAAMAFALTDEFHQAFVTGRRATVMDLGFDYLGAAMSSLGMRWWIEHRQRTRHEPSGPQVVRHML